MIFPFLVPIVGFIAIALTVILLPLARAHARRIESGAQGIPPELLAHIAQMQQSIDAIAVEVERISEGQRFTTKLLAERNGATSATAPWAAEPGQPERRS